MFAMSAEAQQLRDHKLRAMAGAGAFDGAAHNAQALFEIRAVQTVAFHTVAGRALHKRTARELARFGSGVSVLIIRDDEDKRQFFHGGLIERLVPGAGGSAAFANGSGAYGAGFSFETMRHQSAVHDRNHRAEMADHGE